MKGKVDQSSLGIGTGGAKSWRIKGEDGNTYECRPSRDQAADTSTLLLYARLEVEFDVTRKPTGETVVRIVGWQGQSEWADGGIPSAEPLQEEPAPMTYAVRDASPDSPGAGDGQFVNPYNFAGLATRRAPAPGLVAHGGLAASDASHSGSIHIRLTALTPILVPDAEGRKAWYSTEQVPVPDGTPAGTRHWFARFKDERGGLAEDGREAAGHGWRLLPSEEFIARFGDAIEFEEVELVLGDTPDGLRWCSIDVSEARGASGETAFFRLEEDKPAIPLSTLRGVTRSLYEAATNACMSQFDVNGQEGWRPTLDNDEERDMYAGESVEVLPGRVALEPRGRVDGYLEVASESYKVPIQRVLRPQLGQYDFRRAQTTGLKVYFTLNAKGDAVERISTREVSGWKQGWLKESGRMPTKKHEYVLVFGPKPRRVTLTQRQMDQFRDVNKQATSIHPGRMKGQLVWMRVDKRSGQLLSFGRGFLHKVPCEAGGERSTYGKRLPSDTYKPCSETVSSADELCPACSLFGSVMRRARAAYGGRVSFGTAQLTPDSAWSVETVDLQPLSEPKPQTGFFYLRRPDGSLANWNDPRSALAGRKVYLHEVGLTPGHYRRRDFDHANQALTAELLQPGATFEYEVRFKDLRDWEVGALLWCLAPFDPEDKGRQLALKVGGAKPLGLGSMKAELGSGGLKVDVRTDRYRSFEDHLAAQSEKADPEPFLEAYFAKLAELDVGLAQEGTPRWHRELVEALAFEGYPRGGEPLPVRYPARIATSGKLKGKPVVYEWFTWAKKKRPGHPGGGMQLPTVLEMAEDRRQLEGWEGGQ